MNSSHHLWIISNKLKPFGHILYPDSFHSLVGIDPYIVSTDWRFKAILLVDNEQNDSWEILTWQDGFGMH